MTAVISNAQAEPSDLNPRDAEDLMQRLDDLHEQYLNALDQYQKARDQLSKHLSSGYMSLAQANFVNTKGRRYGQDYYDERMQAQRAVHISSPSIDSALRINFDIAKIEVTGEDTKYETEEAKSIPKDPLRWFGVLVPQPLRAAQSSFISAVDDSIPNVMNIRQQLRQLEIDIGRTRKAIKKLEKV